MFIFQCLTRATYIAQLCVRIFGILTGEVWVLSAENVNLTKSGSPGKVKNVIDDR